MTPRPEAQHLRDLRNAAELLRDVGTDDYVNPPTAEAMQSAANDLDGLAGEVERLLAERAGVIDVLNIYADEIVHEQLTLAGLLITPKTRTQSCPLGMSPEDCCESPIGCGAIAEEAPDA